MISMKTKRKDGTVVKVPVGFINNPANLKDYVTPQMYGAKGDGVTDDTDAIQKCLDENYYVFVPRGTYYLTRPLAITKEGMCVFGEQNMSWEKTLFVFDNCHGFIFNGCRYSTFSGISVGAKSTENQHCGFLYAGVHTHKVHLENCMIKNFKYGMSDCLYDTNETCTIWNCSFKHIRTDNVEYGVYFTQFTEGNNNFGVIFEDVFFDNGKVYMTHGKYSFIGCNFGIRTNNYLDMKHSCYTDFTNCNFECDETIASGYCLSFNGKEHVFTNCQFLVKGEPGVYLIHAGSDLRLLKFNGCYSWTDGTATIWGTRAEVGDAGAIRISGKAMAKPYFEQSYYRSAYNDNDGLGVICSYDNAADILLNNTMYYSGNRKRIEYFINGETKDMMGNVKDSSFPINIGGLLYLDGGEVDITENPQTVIVRYNRQVNGSVFVSNPPIIDGTPIMILRDESETYKDRHDLAVYKILMWDASSKSWKDNTKPFVLKWLKISL